MQQDAHKIFNEFLGEDKFYCFDKLPFTGKNYKERLYYEPFEKFNGQKIVLIEGSYSILLMKMKPFSNK